LIFRCFHTMTPRGRRWMTAGFYANYLLVEDVLLHCTTLWRV